MAQLTLVVLELSISFHREGGGVSLANNHSFCRAEKANTWSLRGLQSLLGIYGL